MITEGIREITIEDAKQNGIQTETVAVCKKIRRLAKLDRLSLDQTEHRSGLNKHLFRYIEYCGKDVLTYIKEYLSNLQPYMIERRIDQEKEKSFICVVDKMYRISVYIKIDTKQFEELVISFHEDHIRGVSRTNSLIKKQSSALVPIFADSVGSVDTNTGNASLKVFVTRGMKTLPLNIIGIKCQDFFIVRATDIENQFVYYCNEYIRELYTSNLNLDFSKIEVFSMLQQISFTSYGRDTFSSISLLIDSVTEQKDAISRQAADCALITFCENLQLTKEQKAEIIDLLEEKYKVTAIKSIDDILNRIQMAITGITEDDPLEALSVFTDK